MRSLRDSLLCLVLIISVSSAQPEIGLGQYLSEEEYLREGEVLFTAFVIATHQGDRSSVAGLVGGLRPALWPPEVLEGSLHLIELAHQRQNDILQSWLLETPIISPLPVSAEISHFWQLVDDEDYVPLIQLAARRASSPSWGFSEPPLVGLTRRATVVARGRTVVFEELERAHGVTTPLAALDRELTGLFDWIALYEQGGPGQRAEAALDRLSAYLYSDHLESVLKRQAIGAVASDPELARSYLLHAWVTAHVSLATERWLVGRILDEPTTVGIETVNEHRRLLGLPMVLEADLDHAIRSAQMPDWALTSGRGASEETIGVLDAAYAVEVKRFAVFVPAFIPPELRLGYEGPR